MKHRKNSMAFPKTEAIRKERNEKQGADSLPKHEVKGGSYWNMKQ
jgi:hypothetical protein